MTDAEMQQMLADHYQGEAQMLTTGAEENLLKLAELRGVLGTGEAARWSEIKQQFQRRQAAGGAGADAATRVTAQLVDLVAATREAAQAQQLQAHGAQAASAARQEQETAQASHLQDLLAQLRQAQSASGASLQGIRELLAEQLAQGLAASAPAPRVQDAAAATAADSTDHAARLLGQLVAQSLQPVVMHLEQTRRQQLGLHRVLMQVATRMQEQIDVLGQPRQPTLRAEEIDKAFERMQDGKMG